jgi:hypothetical protein
MWWATSKRTNQQRARPNRLLYIVLCARIAAAVLEKQLVLTNLLIRNAVHQEVGPRPSAQAHARLRQSNPSIARCLKKSRD